MKIDRVRILIGTTVVLLACGALAHAEAGKRQVPYEIPNLLTPVSQQVTAPTKGTTVDLSNLQNPPQPLPAQKPKRVIKKKVTPRPVQKDAPALNEGTSFIVVGERVIKIKTHKVVDADMVTAYGKMYAQVGGSLKTNDYNSEFMKQNPQISNINKIYVGRTVNIPVFDPEVGEPTIAEAAAGIKKAKTLEQKLAEVEKEKTTLTGELNIEREKLQDARVENGRLASENQRLVTENQDLEAANNAAEQEKTALGSRVQALEAQVAQLLATNAQFAQSLAVLTAAAQPPAQKNP